MQNNGIRNNLMDVEEHKEDTNSDMWKHHIQIMEILKTWNIPTDNTPKIDVHQLTIWRFHEDI